MNLTFFRVKSELEVNRKYPDLVLIPTELRNITKQQLDWLLSGLQIELKKF